jgi:hypothetical protein
MIIFLRRKSMITSRHIFAVLPVLDELENLADLTGCLAGQTARNFTLVVCVNQPEQWWNDPDRSGICRRNRESVRLLREIKDFAVVIVDRTSPGRGWEHAEGNVGLARREAMEEANRIAAKDDIIISLDADTTFGGGYFASVEDSLSSYLDAAALAVPYYHQLTGQEETDRAILRYEIYMRHYELNMLRIVNPFAFTALGSAMALPVTSYRAVGGITPHRSGEDFYFLQKLRKYGKVIVHNREKVFPAARFSDRVLFGTGPAMIKGRSGDWKSYPLYPFRLFDEIAMTFGSFGKLFYEDVPTPADGFLAHHFHRESIWQPLRNNARSAGSFVRACRDKFDGLRILQYLKYRQKTSDASDEDNMVDFLKHFHNEKFHALDLIPTEVSLADSPVAVLDRIRNLYAGLEESARQEYMQQWKNL